MSDSEVRNVVTVNGCDYVNIEAYHAVFNELDHKREEVERLREQLDGRYTGEQLAAAIRGERAEAERLRKEAKRLSAEALLWARNAQGFVDRIDAALSPPKEEEK